MNIFDTDVLVAALRGQSDAIDVIVAAGGDGLTTTLNAAELLEGAALAQRPEAEQIRVETFLARLRLLPFGPRAARTYGSLAAAVRTEGTHPGLMDTLVASIALAEGATIVTRNRKHFDRIPGLKVQSW